MRHLLPLDETTVVISASLGGTTPETVEANAVAERKKGATVISLTRSVDSPLTKRCRLCYLPSLCRKLCRKTGEDRLLFELAVELLHQIEGYEHYDAMMAGFATIYDLSQKSAESARKQAKAFAQRFKDEPVIYVMSSGATHEVAYSTSICLLMEMQWIHSGTFHSGEFFHGPF